MQYIIDRFEGDWAVLELSGPQGSSTVQIKKNKLPAGCSEGDVVCQLQNEWQIDELATKQRRDRIREKLKKLL